MKIGKYLFTVLGAVFLTGCAARLPEDGLHLARARLDKSLDYVSTQSEMNLISADIFALAQMERHWIEYRICNQPGYDKIEKDFRKDCDEWDRKAEAEAKKPSSYEGGTLAPYERNRRMEYFVQKRIDELKTKWRKQ